MSSSQDISDSFSRNILGSSVGDVLVTSISGIGAVPVGGGSVTVRVQVDCKTFGK